ncbi:hypothetical protein DTO96_102381 [Ephemeroptericola cinctiostellae]|uniref:Uncharacterized protein n=1 Tax=Ephemeroptericola cinctiostellae TaxID=2268024 RepID=A0A345DE38_9BURK|nr:hypothetical protein [Ephemeroptericola cinctiostellae]AXF86626.1 hypothetical protein DTO96_102381 [Ephemeroptericola cinctiostellae]
MSVRIPLVDVSGQTQELSAFDVIEVPMLLPVVYAQPVAGSATVTVSGCTVTAVGTATAASLSAASEHTSIRRIDYLVTTAATNAIASVRTTTAQCFRGAGTVGGFDFSVIASVATGASTSTTRGFFGLTNATAALTDVNPSTLVNMIGVGWDAGDANLSVMSNAGLVAAAKVGLGAAFPRPSVDRADAYKVRLFCVAGAAGISYEVTNLTSMTAVTGTLTANIPVASTTLSVNSYVSVGGTSSVIGLMFGGFVLKH